MASLSCNQAASVSNLTTWNMCQDSTLDPQKLNLPHECDLLIVCQNLHSHPLPSIAVRSPMRESKCPAVSVCAVGILWRGVRETYIIMFGKVALVRERWDNRIEYVCVVELDPKAEPSQPQTAEEIHVDKTDVIWPEWELLPVSYLSFRSTWDRIRIHTQGCTPLWTGTQKMYFANPNTPGYHFNPPTFAVDHLAYLRRDLWPLPQSVELMMWRKLCSFTGTIIITLSRQSSCAEDREIATNGEKTRTAADKDMLWATCMFQVTSSDTKSDRNLQSKSAIGLNKAAFFLFFCGNGVNHILLPDEAHLLCSCFNTNRCFKEMFVEEEKKKKTFSLQCQ